MRLSTGVAMAASLLAIAASPLAVSQPQAAAAASPLTFDTHRIDPGGFEPRIAVAPNNHRWVSTQSATLSGLVIGGAEVVLGSADGHTWAKTAGDPNPTAAPCCDNDMLVTPTGRLISSIIDNATFRNRPAECVCRASA